MSETIARLFILVSRIIFVGSTEETSFMGPWMPEVAHITPRRPTGFSLVGSLDRLLKLERQVPSDGGQGLVGTSYWWLASWKAGQ
jgi:hypothetical protein